MPPNQPRPVARRFVARALLSLAALGASFAAQAAGPLTIGYSDWPGWVARQVAIDPSLTDEK